MKSFHKVTLLPIVIGLSLAALSLAPTGLAGAQGGPTPTPAPLSQDIIPGASPTPGAGGGLLIPTATPEAGGGLLIPTSTPAGGLIIPTSTPAPTEPSFPPLDETGLTAINLQPSDVPADFAANQVVKTFTAEGMLSDLQNAGASELAVSFQQITATYGWQFSVGISYTSCQPNVPINEIYSEVGQFNSASAGRRFFDDPQVQDFFAAFGYALTPAENVHGWRAIIGPDTGACFPQETEYAVFFEYWGLMLTVSMTANATTDPQLVWSLVDQLIPIVIAHAETLATQPFPPTPTPAVATLVQPKPPTPTAAAKLATLQDIAAAMPTIGDLELQSPPWALDDMTSGTFTASQVVAQYQTGGFYELANAFQSAGQQAGLIGQVTRLWSTGLDCSMAVQDLEITVALFSENQGPATFMNNAQLQQAWLNTGLFTNILPHSVASTIGQLWIGGTTFDPCGPVAYRALVVPHGRFLITISSIADPASNLSDLDDANEYLVEFMIEKLEEAGLK
jgi:hypothetical protein